MGNRVFALFILPFLLFYAFPAQAAEKEERTCKMKQFISSWLTDLITWT